MAPKNNLATIFFAYHEFAEVADFTAFNLNKNQHRILFLAELVPGLTIKQLLETLRISKQAFNVLFRNLAERDLVYLTPDPQDKRSKVINLTPAGLTMITEINRGQAAIIDGILAENNGDWGLALHQLASMYLTHMQE
ncbi:MarR family winged helix-turn-helix transcriptional regulator [Periweissella fabalis]|uniref:Winged helix-turn-helix transcriptional regulator n=1 Tax=Periweissella fabalis TaxID=1070421 RepID=A0A7X6N119_9LACO|nr:MarR family winged helix-turn-helix transcriptional regulator [Periweissella fabalis]MCM0599526.1 winged helix-turn-helix transcriptional regulator [Periweissella fabalis]NKZ23831.1 winged helix-turn-helix transcriptional regulator [Periweissella fabalis]